MASAGPGANGQLSARRPGEKLPKLFSNRGSQHEHAVPSWITPRRAPTGKVALQGSREAKHDGRVENDELRRAARQSEGTHKPLLTPRKLPDLAPKGSILMLQERSQKLAAANGRVVGAVSHQITEAEDTIEDAFLDVPGYVEKRKVVILESEPILVLEKKSIPRFGKTKKTSLQTLRSAEAKLAAEAIMQSRDPGQKPRYAKQEQAKPKGRHQRPLIEVMEVDGAALLGVPGTSHVQQFSTYEHNGRQKQIVIAMHDHKLPRMQGAGGASESDFAVMRSGVAELSKQLVTLRESLRESRIAHNAFNELSKYHTSV